ncbi:MAG: adhesin [Asgard archaea virus VerdaV3]|nr:MAG: adhesin [Asgard archaea virus VerdaV3]
MKTYLYDVFHRYESITDWGALFCSLALSSTQKVEGEYSINMTADDNTVSSMIYYRDMDWSKFEDLVFSVYHPDYTDEIGWIALYTDVDNFKIWVFDFAASWTERVIDLSSTPYHSEGTLDLSNITFLRIHQQNTSTPGEDYYFDFFRGRSNIVDDITYFKITEEMGMPSFAELKIKGDSLDHFQAGLEIEVYDKDDVLSWTGRILYPEGVMEGTKVVGKLKALGSNNAFNNIYRKNYTTARSSDYILKDITDNALTKYHSYDDEIDDFSALTYKYDLKTKIFKTNKYLSMLERAVIGYLPNNERFANKYDNLSKGPQIYQGTYNFRDEVVGTSGTDIDFVDFATDGTEVSIIASLDRHKKVLQNADVGTSNGVRNDFTATTSGIVEFWFRSNDVTSRTNLQLRDGGDDIIYLRMNVSELKYYVGAVLTATGLTMVNDTWYHIKVQLYADNTYDYWIDGVQYANGVATQNDLSGGIDHFYLWTYVHTDYLDALGYSWDANYNVGDNLKCWDEITKKIRITSYTPNANRHITRTPVIGANNDLGQVYYVGKASDTAVQKYGLNYLQTWRDPEISNYTEAKQLGDNLLAVYSMDTQMIAMLVVGKGHLQVGKTLNLGWAGVFSITQNNLLLTKRVWYPIPDISELELTDNILTRKAFNVKVINKFYDEDAQQSYDEPDVAESTVAGTVESLHSIAQLRSPTYLDAVIAAAAPAGVNYRRVEHTYKLTRNGTHIDLDCSAQITEGDTVLLGVFTLTTNDTVSGEWANIYRYGGSVNCPTVYRCHLVADLFQSDAFQIELPSNKLTYRMFAGLSNADLFFHGYLYI